MTTSPLPTAQLSTTLIVYQISIAAATRYGRSARGACLPVIRCLAFCLCLLASRQKGRRVEIGSPSWFCAVAHHAAQPPRASRPPLYSWLRSLVNRLIAHASLRLRFMIERRFRHTPNRGSVAPRRTSNRRFTGDSFHSSLLRRSATEPPESLPTPSTRSACSTRQIPLRTLRLCVSALNISHPALHVLHVLHGQTSLRTLRLCASALNILPNPSFPQSIPPNLIVFK